MKNSDFRFFLRYRITTNFKLKFDNLSFYELYKINQSEIKNKNNRNLYRSLKITVNRLKTPSIIYFGIKNIEALDNGNFFQTHRKTFRKNGLSFYLLEPLSTYRTDNRYSNYYCEYDNEEQSLVRSYELDSIENFCKKYEIKSVAVYSTENGIKNTFGNQYSRLHLATCESFYWPYGEIIFDFSFDPDIIIKKFFCGNKRYAAHKHLIASYLIASVPIETLNISWFTRSNINDLPKQLDIELFKGKKDRLLKGIEELDNIAPMTFDIKLESKIPIHLNYHIDFQEQNVKKPYEESFCAIVNETRFFQSTFIPSEKIINAMINKKFFILVGPPCSLGYLKAIGFQTFDHWIDESYDKELNHITRLMKIFDLIDYINSKDIDELRLLYKEMQEVIIHNLDVVQRLDTFYKKFL